MNTLIIAIDPGVSGGIAVYENGEIDAYPMPDTNEQIYQALFEITKELRDGFVCYLEKTGSYVHGESAVNAAKFARHNGFLEGVLMGLDIPTILVNPQVWQSEFSPLSTDKVQRKRQIKEYVQTYFKHLKVTLKTGDALGILKYAMRIEGVN